MRAGRHDADFAHSLTDLMSGVAVMFLVIAAIFMVQALKAKQKAQALAAVSAQRAEENQDYARRFREIDERDRQGIQEIEALRERLQANQGVSLEYDKRKDPRLLTIVFNRDSLQFASGACEVPGATREVMRETLRQIFPTICQAVGSTSTGLQKTITLEGHTDNAPPLGVSCKGIAAATACFQHKDATCKDQGFKANVQLSAARAQHVFFEARDALRDQPAVAQCLERNFMVAGRGPMEPLDGGPWDQVRGKGDNEKNRAS